MVVAVGVKWSRKVDVGFEKGGETGVGNFVAG